MRVLIKTVIILFILLIQFNISLAEDNFPLTGPEWKGKTRDQIIFREYHESFPALYRITEDNPDSDDALDAFALMKTTFQFAKLDMQYEKGYLMSDELKKVLKETIETAKDPKNAKDYFYKGLFAYPSDGESTPLFTDLFTPFEYVIKNYPDSIYAKYSCIFLADNYSDDYRYKYKVADLLLEYLEKYKGKHTALIYYRIMMADNNLFSGGGFTGTEEEKKQINLTLKYAEKILNEFPENNHMVADALKITGNIKKNSGNREEALKYFYKIYNDDKFEVWEKGSAFQLILKIYSYERKIDEMEKILEDAKSKYFYDRFFRKDYREFKFKVESVKRFNSYVSLPYNEQIKDQRLLHGF